MHYKFSMQFIIYLWNMWPWFVLKPWRCLQSVTLGAISPLQFPICGRMFSGATADEVQSGDVFAAMVFIRLPLSDRIGKFSRLLEDWAGVCQRETVTSNAISFFSNKLRFSCWPDSKMLTEEVSKLLRNNWTINKNLRKLSQKGRWKSTESSFYVLNFVVSFAI